MELVNYTKQKTKFCLETQRVELLIEKLGRPDREYGIVHIAGTNGKGSVGAFIRSGIVSMGKKCGHFSSPPLFDTNDSITIDGKAIENSKLFRILDGIKDAAHEVELETGKAPSPFELLFAASLVHFKNEDCDVAILECGMGGEGDATNIIDKADAIVITNIDYDHMDYLGDSIAEIAANKCGIIKPCSRVFSAVQTDDAKAQIIKKCKSTGSSLEVASPFRIKSYDSLSARVEVGKRDILLSLSGVHQAQNAALAAKVLKDIYGIGDNELIIALTGAKNRARLEKIADNLYFDGAHNPSGVRSLAETLNASRIDGKIIFAVGFMADKDIKTCLENLKMLKNRDFEIYTSTVQTNPRALSGEEIAKIARELGYSAKSFDTISDAVTEARQNADKVFVFGSLYMYKELFKNKKGTDINEDR